MRSERPSWLLACWRRETEEQPLTQQLRHASPGDGGMPCLPRASLGGGASLTAAALALHRPTLAAAGGGGDGTTRRMAAAARHVRWPRLTLRLRRHASPGGRAPPRRVAGPRLVGGRYYAGRQRRRASPGSDVSLAR